MDRAALAEPRRTDRGFRPRYAIVALSIVIPAAIGIRLWLHATLPFPTFVGACERLRASRLPADPRDWFCQPTSFGAHASYAIALLIASVGVVLPCVILAATGRRWSSLLPLALAPWITLPGLFGSSSSQSDWVGASLSASMIGHAALLAAPVVAIWLTAPRRSRRASAPRRDAVVAVGFVCTVASVGVALASRSILDRHWSSIGTSLGSTAMVPAVIAIALFGLMLEVDRRWWPWSLAPVALMLSMAPSVAVLRGPENWSDWSQFGIVLPLAAVGLIWSLARPGAAAFSRRLDRAAPPTDGLAAPAVHPAHRGPVRPVVALNAAAAAVLILSVLLFRDDPLPTRIATGLPTYLGVRVQAEDVRTKLDLRRAIATAVAFSKEHGSDVGFDATAATRADPSLAWSDGHRLEGSGLVSALTMSIEPATGGTIQIAALSASNAAFCIERASDGTITYGSGPGPGTPGSRLRQAIARCGSTPWSGVALARIDLAHLCDGTDPSGGYLLCRMVQVLVVNTMRQTKPF
jgi:hypothetical protein